MTNQEAFDAVWDHFITKGQPQSIDEHGTCLYRGPNGARCAAGVLIPDEVYNEEIETSSYDSPTHARNEWRNIRDYLAPVELDLVRSMQSAHDEWVKTDPTTFQQHMAAELRKIGVRFNLNLPGPLGWECVEGGAESP